MSSGILHSLNKYKKGINRKESFENTIVCKVSGVSFDGRQENINKVNHDTELKLVRDKENVHDYYAVSVMALIEDEWKDIGFIPSSINVQVAEAMDRGILLEAVLKKKTGFGEYLQGLTLIIKKER